MVQEGSAYGTGRHPHCEGGLSLWHKRAVHMAQDCRHGTGKPSPWHRKTSPWQRRAVPMAQESSLHGTGRRPHGKGGLSPWHRKAVSMAQEGCPYGTGNQSSCHRTASPWQSRNPSDKRKSPTHAHRHALAGIRFRTTNYTTTRGRSKMQAT